MIPGSQAEAPLILVVDDDDGVRNGLDRLLRSVGFRVEPFASARELLESHVLKEAHCMVLDVRMPIASGFDLQAELARNGIKVPIVFITGHGDIPMTVRAMKTGAVDFLAKPFREQDLLDAVVAAVETDRKRRSEDEHIAGLTKRYADLSDREKQVMTLATAGLMNKRIAFELGLSEITVKVHRGRVMRKMQVATFADLVRVATSLGVRRS
jgi:FixJ family two-component response regulator